MKRVFLAICLVLIPITSNAEISNEEALNEIAAFAEKFCGRYLTEGESENSSIGGSVKAELDGLLRKLTNVGIEGAASIDSESYIGVLRKDLSNELQDVRDCKERIWNDLKTSLIKQTPTSEESAGSLNIPHASEIDDEDGRYQLWGEITVQIPLDPGEHYVLKGQELYSHRATFPRPSCAGPGLVLYTWLIRDPYPQGGEVVIRHSYRGITDVVGTGTKGSVGLGWCAEHTITNSGIKPILIEVRYASAIYRH